MNHSLSCACGALSVEVSDGVGCAFSAVCHCANCREVTGTASFWANAFPTAEVKITGEVISYQHAVNLRCSCAKCGSFMYEHVPPMGLTMLPAARLSNPTPPMCHIWTKSAVYELPEDGKPRFDEMPPG